MLLGLDPWRLASTIGRLASNVVLDGDILIGHFADAQLHPLTVDHRLASLARALLAIVPECEAISDR